jgi:hypothetical protein
MVTFEVRCTVLNTLGGIEGLKPLQLEKHWKCSVIHFFLRRLHKIQLTTPHAWLHILKKLLLNFICQCIDTNKDYKLLAKETDF